MCMFLLILQHTHNNITISRTKVTVQQCEVICTWSRIHYLGCEHHRVCFYFPITRLACVSTNIWWKPHSGHRKKQTRQCNPIDPCSKSAISAAFLRRDVTESEREVSKCRRCKNEPSAFPFQSQKGIRKGSKPKTVIADKCIALFFFRLTTSLPSANDTTVTDHISHMKQNGGKSMNSSIER